MQHEADNDDAFYAIAAHLAIVVQRNWTTSQHGEQMRNWTEEIRLRGNFKRRNFISRAPRDM